jgi:hypothetical protein
VRGRGTDRPTDRRNFPLDSTRSFIIISASRRHVLSAYRGNNQGETDQIILSTTRGKSPLLPAWGGVGISAVSNQCYSARHARSEKYVLTRTILFPIGCHSLIPIYRFAATVPPPAPTAMHLASHAAVPMTSRKVGSKPTRLRICMCTLSLSI